MSFTTYYTCCLEGRSQDIVKNKIYSTSYHRPDETAGFKKVILLLSLGIGLNELYVALISCMHQLR